LQEVRKGSLRGSLNEEDEEEWVEGVSSEGVTVRVLRVLRLSMASKVKAGVGRRSWKKRERKQLLFLDKQTTRLLFQHSLSSLSTSRAVHPLSDMSSQLVSTSHFNRFLPSSCSPLSPPPHFNFFGRLSQVFGGDLASFAAPYCLPSHPCWPQPNVWSSLNETVAGKLIKPLGAPVGTPAEAADPFWRVQQTGVMFLNFECVRVFSFSSFRARLTRPFFFPASRDGVGCDHCDLPSNNATASSVESGAAVSQDRTSAYVLNATSIDDVVSAVQFAKEHHVRLRVKNTGHDYLGRSGDHGSFTLWTHHLKDSKFEADFVPEGAPEGTKAEKALRVGAGNVVKDLYEAADKAGVVVTAGVSQTVGGAGGFALGGGHGPFAPSFGLAADSASCFSSLFLPPSTLLSLSPSFHSPLYTPQTSLSSLSSPRTRPSSAPLPTLIPPSSPPFAAADLPSASSSRPSFTPTTVPAALLVSSATFPLRRTQSRKT
jgi:hypothetical protein